MKEAITRFLGRLPVRSLAARTTLVFAGLVTLVWTFLVLWLIVDSLTRGREVGEKDMRDYSAQVLAVAELWPADDQTLAQALNAVVNIENNSLDGEARREADSPAFALHVWRQGQLIADSDASKRGEGPPEIYDQVIEYQHKGVDRWAYATRSATEDVVVRLSFDAPISSVIGWPSVSIFLLPLVLTLPLLLIPAWVMTRFGLKPLQTMTGEILSRVELGDLSPLATTRYKELNPLIVAMNKLMHRLSRQIERERGFVADVAHEIKTPLAALAANAGTAISSRDADRRRAALVDLEPGLERVTHLVQQLLGMAKLDVEAAADSARAIDLAEFIRERISMQLTVAHGRNIRLEARLPDRLMITINPDQIGAIIDNVVGNAVKYSPDGGRIAVVLREAEDGSNFEINVSDNGPGVPPEDRERVFDRFYRRASLLQQADGAGLGLAITKRAVDRLGGSIALTDSADGGLSVTIKIPGSG